MKNRRLCVRVCAEEKNDFRSICTFACVYTVQYRYWLMALNFKPSKKRAHDEDM